MPTYYLNADTGDDTTGDGSSGNPWLTISKAASSSIDGDTIVFQTATAAYTLSGAVTFTGGRTFQGASGDADDAVIDWGGNNYSILFSGDLTLTDLTFKNFTSSSFDVCPFEIFGSNITWIIDRCKFISMTVHASPSFTGRGGLFYQGFSQTDNTITISNSGFFDCRTAAGGYVLSIGSNATNTLTITGCVFTRLSGSTCTGIMTKAALGTLVIKNVIFYNGGTSVDMFSASQTATFNNNCYYGTWANVPSGSNNITDDPLFVDLANHNTTLRPASPCIGTGVDL